MPLLTLNLPDDLDQRIRDAAARAGVTPEEWVRDLVAFDIEADQDADLADDIAIATAFDQDGNGVDWADARAWIKTWGDADECPPPEVRTIK